MAKRLKSFFVDVGFCIKLIWQASRNAFLVTLLFKAFGIASAVANLFITKYLINKILDGIGSNDFLGYIVLLIIVYSIYNMFFQFIDDYGRKVTSIITMELTTHLNISVMRKSVNLDYEYFDIPEKYNEFLRNQRSVSSLQNIVNTVIDFIGSTVMFISMLVCCISFSPIWTIISVAVLVPKYIFSVRFAKKGYELEKNQYNEAIKRDYLHSLFFSKTQSQELRYNNAIDNVIARYKLMTEKLIYEKEKHGFNGKWGAIICSIPDLLFIPALSIVLVNKISKGLLTIGDLSYITGIYNNLGAALIRLIAGISSIYKYDERIKDFKEYYGYIEKNRKDGGKEIDSINSIEFRNVYFKYPGRNEYALKNLSLKISAKEKVAIVGLNGSGKTTIFKLLCGFYEPESGSILINGEPYSTFSLTSIRKHMAVLFQDYTIYSLSIYDNVSVSDLESVIDDGGRVKSALEMAGFHNAVYDKTQDTGLYIGKEFSSSGILPSGGQRQKIAIARALYRKADLIMLDEPSSALDPESEYNMLTNLDYVYREKIIIMITHKLNNTKRMDHIYCINNGTVEEEGTHDELICKCGMYYEMFTAQNAKRAIS